MKVLSEDIIHLLENSSFCLIAKSDTTASKTERESNMSIHVFDVQINCITEILYGTNTGLG